MFIVSELRKKFAVLSGCLFACAFVAGCGGNPVPSLAEMNDTNMKKIRGAYGLFQMRHNLVGPKDEEEFKGFLKTDEGAKVKLARMGVAPEQVDGMFVSERDGKPFRIKYGLTGLSDRPIIFEVDGVDGKRLVAYTRPRELDKAEYDAAWESKGKAPTKMDPFDQSGGN